MDEFQGSFVSFINKPKVVIRPVPIVPKSEEIDEVDEIVPKSEVIDEVDAGAQDQEEDGEESIVETGMYEVVPEGDIEASEEQPEKLIETPEMIYNRLHSELELLAQACQDDFLYQITNEEYLSLASAESTSLNRLSKLIFTWCNKNLRIFRVCKECDFRAVHAREINRHILGNESCKSYYYALGTFDAPSNYMQCQGCNYSTNVRGNMNRHQATRGHTGIEMIGGGGAGSSSGSSVQQQPLQEEWFTPVEAVGQQSEVVQLPNEVEVVESVPVPVQMQQVQVPVAPLPESSITTEQDQLLADITMWPKDDDSGGHISNLQTRLEQQVENSDGHFIFRISDEEYAALCEQRAHHMAKFSELVNIYCNKTLKLYRVCDGCGFATFMRQDMIKHFETGTCPLSYFNALGTCDDDDPNREVEENEAEEVAGFQITQVTSEAAIEIEPEGVDRYIQPKVPKTDTIFKCPHCGQEMSLRNKSRHLKLNCPILAGKEVSEKPKIPKNKTCWHCQQSFNTYVKLKHHVRLNHLDESGSTAKLSCDGCPKQFKFPFYLNQHKRTDCPGSRAPDGSPAPKKVFRPVKLQCPDCLIYFLNKADLIRHQSQYCKAVQRQPEESCKVIQQQTEDSGRRVLYQCQDCQILCASTADLGRHQKYYCRMRPVPLESVIKVEETSVEQS